MKLTEKMRKRIPRSEWGLWKGTAAKSKYPMPDRSHAASAKGRAKAELNRGNLSQREYSSVVRKADKILKGRATRRKKRKANPMAKSAVVNRKRRKATKRRKPRAYGAAKKRTRRRNPTPAGKPSPYSSGGYYRRPNPNMFDLDTYTRTLPAATAGVTVARWAVNLAGPFEPDAQGIPVPGFKHAIAIMVATQFGGTFIGNLLGGRREIDIAQIAAIGYGGDLFLRKRIMRDSPWYTENISLEGDEWADTVDEGMGADTYTDPAGNKYVRTPTGWQLSDWSFGQAEEVPADAEPGDIVQTPSGDIFEVMADGNMEARPDLGRFYNPQSVASQLVAPTNTLPGGSYPSDMQGFTQQSPLGDFQQTSPLGMHARPADNSFGYAA